MYEVPREIESTEAGSRMVVVRGWGRGNGELVFNGAEFQFGEMKRSGDGWW